jgi:FkbM family methyltransferase
MHSSLFHDLILHGENLFRTGYVQEALQAFESVIAQEPHHVLALNNKGVILHSLGMYAEAEQIFLDILDRDNTNTSTVFNLASLYIEQYNIKGAESVIISHKSCLDEKDINELKAKLYGVKNELNIANTLEKTKIVNISMDVYTKKHTFNLHLNEREPGHRAICACFAKNELYKSGLAKFLATVLQMDDCFIDIGSYIGYFSLLGATLVGDNGRVLSFEPEEKNYRYFHENIAINNFSNIKLFNNALGLETKTAKMFINADNDAGHALWNVGCHPDYLKSRLHCLTRDVQVASLDSLLQGVHLPNLRLINIDACGAELDIIQGAVSTIEAYKVPYVVCGINRFSLQQMGTSEQELRQFLGYMGYEPYWLQDEAPHLGALAPEQSVSSEQDLHVVFANPTVLGEDVAQSRFPRKG